MVIYFQQASNLLQQDISNYTDPPKTQTLSRAGMLRDNRSGTRARRDIGPSATISGIEGVRELFWLFLMRTSCCDCIT